MAKKRKISEMIWEFAGDFIRIGPTLEQRQIRLNAACSAWNITCNPSGRRQKLLDDYMHKYQHYNPHVSQADCAAIRSDIEKLIQGKTERFPADLRQIFGAQLLRKRDKDRIEVVSGR